MKIKRCFIRFDGPKDGAKTNLKMPVRAFVHKYCSELSDKLWGGDLAAQHAMNLDDFEWTNTKFAKGSSRAAVRRYRDKLKSGSSRAIPLSGGSLGTRQWDKVK